MNYVERSRSVICGERRMFDFVCMLTGMYVTRCSVGDERNVVLGKYLHTCKIYNSETKMQ